MENNEKDNEREIPFEPDFRDAFMSVYEFLAEANLPLELVYKNKKPKNLPKNISDDWETVQAFYEQKDRKEKETGDIILL